MYNEAFSFRLCLPQEHHNNQPRLRHKPVTQHNASHASSPTSARGSTCADMRAECGTWRSDAQCITNPQYMLITCPASCGVCAALRVTAQPLLRIHTHRGPLNLPAIGLGTAGLGDRTLPAVHAALRAGYKLLDTAAVRLHSMLAFCSPCFPLLRLCGRAPHMHPPHRHVSGTEKTSWVRQLPQPPPPPMTCGCVCQPHTYRPPTYTPLDVSDVCDEAHIRVDVYIMSQPRSQPKCTLKTLVGMRHWHL